jgi:hypothetical protein
MNLYVSKDNQQLGPYTLDQARQFVASGNLLSNDWAWYDGGTDWVPLEQVPGFALAAPEFPPAPLPAAFASADRPRRPILVWIICLFYFVILALGMISVAATPFLLSFSDRMQQRADDSIQSQIDRAGNAEQKDKLVRVQNQIRANRAQMATVMHHGIFYYAYAIFSMLVNLAAAILFFLLRRAAFPAFIATFIVSVIGAVYNFATMTFPHVGGVAQSIGFLIGISIAVVNWGIMLAIIFYAWLLAKRGVLR